MGIIEALPIKGMFYRYRATIRWTERAAPMPLCSCKYGHSDEATALACKQAERVAATHGVIIKDYEEVRV